MTIAIIEKMKQAAQGTLTDHLGFELVAAGAGSVTAAFEVKPHHLAPNGYLHAASIIMLADSCCGFGCMMHLPEGAQSFTTIEIKSTLVLRVMDVSNAKQNLFIKDGLPKYGMRP